jgi:hypothetical protein
LGQPPQRRVEPPGLADVEAEPQQSYAGGLTLPDGRVLCVPYNSRDLVVWDPGCGVAFGRDVALIRKHWRTA